MFKNEIITVISVLKNIPTKKTCHRNSNKYFRK